MTPRVLALARVWRVARVGGHAFAGFATTIVVFPFIDASAKRDRVRRWSARLLELLKVDARVHGALDLSSGNILIVANHVSWLDIFVINAQHPARFVAKSELGGWPIAGRLMRSAGTIFVARERRHDTRRVNHAASQALAGGDIIAVFPEGTTTDGSTLLRFHASLLQPIVESQGQLLPVAIRYRDAHGVPTAAAAYVGDDSFIKTLWQICGERALSVDLMATAPIPARALHRRELARAAETAIRKALGLPAGATEPGIRADRAAEPR